MSEKSNKKWKTAIYVRLSKDDGDKLESNSITNQKDLINEYLKSYSDIKVVATKVDDGYSGVNFERPAFLEMMEEIKKGQVNCVVVKDLSRFGRNFEQTGKYLEQIFPFLGVRFISVNDRIDSTKDNNSDDGLIIPFKNLINDAYCRDISIKIKSQLDIKRKKGEFIAPFAVYGYLKGSHIEGEEKLSKHVLVVDEYASLVVKDIFKWKIEGQSNLRIAERLDELGVLPPSEYKKAIGLNYNTTFKETNKCRWSENAIRRILVNDVYIGTLSQGKVGKPNHKISKCVKKDKSEWVVIENNHEPIISKEDFYLVNELSKKDTRVAVNKEKVYLLSGIIKCADCGQNMIRKTTTYNGKKYFYYVCVTNKQTKQCSSHSINFDDVEIVVEHSIRAEISKMLEVGKLLNNADLLPLKSNEIKKLKMHIATNEEELVKYEKYKVSLLEKFLSDIISKDDYLEFRGVYDKNIQNISENIKNLNTKIGEVSEDTKEKNSILKKIKKYQKFKVLTREMIVTMIDEILVFNDKSLEIKYKFNEIQELEHYTELLIPNISGKEIIVNG